VRCVTQRNESARGTSLQVMSSLATDNLIPLTLSEQLDAMLAGWLDRNAPDYDADTDGVAGAIVTVAEREWSEVATFCAAWGLTARRVRGDGRLAVLVVEGPAMPVRGFTEITAMYRR
jgi:hypothetical protein